MIEEGFVFPVKRSASVVSIPLKPGDLAALMGSPKMLGVAISTQWPARSVTVNLNAPGSIDRLRRIVDVLKEHRGAFP